MGKPKVSITMTVYNAEVYIGQALQSIFEQSFSDFEVILVDDGSTDCTWEIIEQQTDSRLVAIQSEHNYIHSLNIAQQLAQGEYIARMDADDLMHPHRLSLQVALMDRFSDVDICTTWTVAFNQQGYTAEFGTMSGYIKEPLFYLLSRNDFIHPTAMVRREFWERYDLQYLDDYIYAEDYKMWVESAIKGATFYVLPELLHYYRASPQQVSNVHNKEQNLTAKRIRDEVLRYLIRQCKDQELLEQFAVLLNSMVEKGHLTSRERTDACAKILRRLSF